MTYTTTQFRLGPDFTPSAVRKLIFLTLVISLGTALIDPFLTRIFGFWGFQYWLSLSWYGLTHLCIWQPVSYLFVEPAGMISFYYLIRLAFMLYILWIMGSAIVERVGVNPFLRLYFTSGLLAGLLTIMISKNVVLAGPAPALLALLIVWTMLMPDMEILLFFLIPVKIKWLSLGIVGAIFLVNLSQLNFPYFIFYLTGALVGYLYATLAWGLVSPFPITHPFDKKLARLRVRWKWKKRKTKDSSKIINLKTGKPDLSDDDRFVDAMLTKISKYGEQSLTWQEKRRLNKISENKKKG